MNGHAVVDASVATKWLIDEPDTDKADALAQSWVRSGIQPVAPYLMPVEVANVLHQRVRKGRVSRQEAARLIQRLLDSGVEFREPAGLHTRAIELASQLGQSAVYDAHYLALAEMIDCELWTADQRYYRAVRSAYPRARLLRTFSD